MKTQTVSPPSDVPKAEHMPLETSPLVITALVPTYRRTEALQRCLEAFARQTRPPDEVIVTVRNDDEETRAFFEKFDSKALPLQIVAVDEPGAVAAMNAGLTAARGDVFTITDDDAAPFPDWLERIERHFRADDGLAGVGGRDRLHYEDGTLEERNHPVVGKLQWHGRVITNHHLGFGPPREVDVLKGVNCAYRTGPLRRIGFDTRLRGAGAQIHWELSLGLALKRGGWRLVYDPAIGVDHYPASRLDADVNQRGGFHALSLQNIVYNETLVLKEHLPGLRRGVFLLWAISVGTREAPGWLQAFRLARTDRHIWGRRQATLAGRIDAWRGGGHAPFLGRPGEAKGSVNHL